MQPTLPIATTGFRPAPAVNPLVWAWLAFALLTLEWDFAGLDIPIMLSLGTPEGFPLRDNWWLSTLLHDRLRLTAQLLFGVMLVWALWPVRGKALPRRERWLLVGLVLLSLLAVNIVKSTSRTSCPWDLQAFGGQATYVSHWIFGVGDGGGGRCFPGGHASSAFAFFALCLPWLNPPAGAQRRQQAGWAWLALVLVVGVIAGATQTLRGAHYPSHSFWTLVICSGISLAGWWWGQRWLQRAGAAGKP
jgi:membrane-associated PAP2 superfamily phosphatase